MSWLELLAAGLGIIAVWLTVKQNPWCWPIGLVMVLLYAWLFYDWRLYSNLLLQLLFLLVKHVLFLFLQVFRCDFHPKLQQYNLLNSHKALCLVSFVRQF